MERVLFIIASIAVCSCQVNIQPIYITDQLPSSNKEAPKADVIDYNGGSSAPTPSLPMITTTMLGFAEFVTTKGNTVVHFKPSTDASTTQALSQIVRIVVNTVVSSDDKTAAHEDDKQPIGAAAIAITSSTLFTAQIQPTVQPISVKSLSQINDVTPSRNDKRKIEVVAQHPDHKDVTPIPESSFTSDIFTDSGEVHVQIAEHGGHAEASEHAHVSARAISASTVPPSVSVTLPTGLVTVLGSTVVQSGQTTVHETRVLGTYIGGTYAQILQSTSKIYNNGGGVIKTTSSNEASSSSVRFTLTPTTVEPSKSSSFATFKRPSYSGIVRSKSAQSSVKSTSAPSTSSPFLDEAKTRFSRELSPSPTTKSPSATPSARGRQGRKNLYSSLAAQRSRIVSNRNKAQLKTITAMSLDAMLTSSIVGPSKENHETVMPSTVLSEKVAARRSTSVSSRKGRTRLTIRAKTSSTRSNSARKTDRNAIMKPTRSYSRLTYTPNPSKYYNRRRFRFKTARTSDGEEGKEDNLETINAGESQEARNIEMTSVGDIRPSTTLTVTSTFTTELTQYYGPRSEMKSLVFTTTYEQPVVVTKPLDAAAELAARLAWEEDGELDAIAPTEPLILGISTSANTQVSDTEDEIDNEDDDSGLDDSGENGGEAGYATATPPLVLSLDSIRNTNSSAIPFMLSVSFSTVSDDFTTTETVLHTSLLPVFDGTSTVVYSLTQQYFVTKIVHALKMVPPEELIPFVIPANRKRISNDVNPDLNAAESEHREDSVFPSGNGADDDFLEQLSNKSDILGLLNLTSNDITNNRDGGNDKQRHDIIPASSFMLSPTSMALPLPSPTPYGQGMNPFFNPFINPLAYLGLGLPFGGGGSPDQVITTSRPVYSTETIYGTKVLPIWDGLRTSYHTTKAPSTTKVHTNYETYTTQMGAPAAQGLQYGNNFPQPVQTVTTLTTLVTTETLTSTQVLKLMYDGYKTSYRTLYSTTETVKTLTTQTTTTVPFAANIPPYFG